MMDAVAASSERAAPSRALYDAFISYSHAKDKPIASALQGVMQRLGKPWHRRRALRIFRDDTSLAATPELWPTIEQALAQSRYLIVLASPQFVHQDPFFVGNNLLTGTDVGSYEVALLRVAPGPALSPILELATREELEKIEPGYPVMRTGYPTENVVGAEVNALLAATPNLAQGMISGMTDMFRLPADAKHRRLIHHSVPSAGGASGSPLVGPNGKIVALNNAGSYIFVAKEVVPAGRISSSAQVNYGQRADWILDLLEKKADATLAEDRKYWERQAQQFKRGIDVLVPYVLDRQRPRAGAEPMLRNRAKARLAKTDAYEVAATPGKPSATKRQRIYPVKLTGGRASTLLGYGENRAGIQIYLVVDGKIVSQDEREVFLPVVTYTPSRDMNAEIYVTGADQDVNYTFFHFDWEPPKS